MVLFLPAKKQLEVFNPAEHEDGNGTYGADDEHRFENSHQHRDDNQTHRQTVSRLCYLKLGRLTNSKIGTERFAV